MGRGWRVVDTVLVQPDYDDPSLSSLTALAHGRSGQSDLCAPPPLPLWVGYALNFKLKQYFILHCFGKAWV